MINRTKFFLAALTFVFWTVTSEAQSAWSDLQYAVQMSQMAANESDAEKAYNLARSAFDGSENNYYSYFNSSPTMTELSSNNTGVEWARFYMDMRAERTRLVSERKNRMLVSYLQMVYEKQDQREANLLMFVEYNSQTRPFSQEVKDELISNRLPGNVLISDDGTRNFMPEALLEGAGGQTTRTLKDKLERMSIKEIDEFVKELYDKHDNDEELSGEEWAFLRAWEEHKVAVENNPEDSNKPCEPLEDKVNSMSEEEVDKYAEELYKQHDKGEELCDEEWAFLHAWEKRQRAKYMMN